MLDVHFNEAGLQRLQERIEGEARPRRKRVLLRAVLLAAALFLLAVSVVWWLPTGGNAEPQLALLGPPGSQSFELRLPPRGRDAEPAVHNLEALKGELVQAQREGRLPPPDIAGLELTLVNNGKRPIEASWSGAAESLALDVQGAGVLRLPAPDAADGDVLRPRSIPLEPGERHVIPIRRLAAGSHGKLEYIYLTEPGEYTVTPHLKLTVAGRDLTLTGEPIRITVKK